LLQLNGLGLLLAKVLEKFSHCIRPIRKIRCLYFRSSANWRSVHSTQPKNKK